MTNLNRVNNIKASIIEASPPPIQNINTVLSVLKSLYPKIQKKRSKYVHEPVRKNRIIFAAIGLENTTKVR